MSIYARLILMFLLFVLPLKTAYAQNSKINTISLGIGLYASSGLATNGYIGLRYNHLLSRGKYFVEGAIGIGSVKSKVLESVSDARIFDGNGLFTYQFVFGYDSRKTGTIPYVVAGFAGISQGGQSRFAGVIGFGKRFAVGSLFNTNNLGFRFDVRDQIFSQEFNDAGSFVSHNIVATVGIEYYY